MPAIAYNPPTHGYSFGAAEPGLRLPSGATIACACPDSDGFRADGTPLPDSQRDRGSIIDGFEGNPVIAPLAIDAAEPGDCLCVTIKEIILDRRLGRTLLAPNHGLLHAGDLRLDVALHPHMYEWDIDVAAGVATLRNPLGVRPIAVPLRPFIGCIGVAPADGKRISTLYAGDHGGNLDLPFLAPGATLYLPVNTPGGLLSFGDIHAAQGHGEIVGGAIETSGRVTVTLDVRKNQLLAGPRAKDAQRIYAVATHADLREGFRIAAARLLRWIGTESEIYARDAYVMLSQSIEMIAGNCVVAPYTVAAAVRIDALPAELQRLLGESR